MEKLNFNQKGEEGTFGIPSEVINADWRDEAEINAKELRNETLIGQKGDLSEAWADSFAIFGANEQAEASYLSPEIISEEAEKKILERNRKIGEVAINMVGIGYV